MRSSPTHEEELFLHTLDDLRGRIRSSDPYTILGASALIRKLLLDSTPLVDQVNREYKLKIRFEVTEPRPFPPDFPQPMFRSVQDGLDPETAPPAVKRVSMARDNFLAYELSTVEGHAYTLREVVLFEANVMGGVHAGAPREEKEQALQEIGSMIQVGGYRASLRQLQAIGRVVIRALEPLEAAVRGRHGV